MSSIDRTLKVGLLVLSFVSTPTIRADDALLARFRSEAPEAWAEYEQLAREVEGKVLDVRVWRGTRRDRAERYEHEFRFAGEQVVHIERVLEGTDKGEETAIAFNNDYCFSLKRSNPAAPWAVTFLGRESDYLRKRIRGDAVIFATHAIYVSNKRLPELLEDPGFGIKSIEPTEDGLALLEFVYTSAPDPKSMQFHDGKLWLDPARLWTLVRFDLSTGPTTRTTKSFEFFESESAFPRLRKCHETILTKSGGTLNWTFDYRQYEQRQVPDEAFRLTAFGVPEPAELASSPLRIWWILLIVGVVLLSVALLLWRGIRGAR